MNTMALNPHSRPWWLVFPDSSFLLVKLKRNILIYGRRLDNSKQWCGFFKNLTKNFWQNLKDCICEMTMNILKWEIEETKFYLHSAPWKTLRKSHTPLTTHQVSASIFKFHDHHKCLRMFIPTLQLRHLEVTELQIKHESVCAYNELFSRHAPTYDSYTIWSPKSGKWASTLSRY